LSMGRTPRKSTVHAPVSTQIMLVLGIILVLSLVLWSVLGQRSVDAVDETVAEQPGPITDPESNSEYRPTIETAQQLQEKDPKDKKDPTDKKKIPVVIVLDDVGYDMKLLETFLRIPIPLTYAILPGLRDTKDSARILNARGVETILHLPMENVAGTYPGPGTLFDTMADEELLAVLQEDIEQVPGISGMNNHMGSKGTQDERIVQIVLDYGRSRGLFFLDSRTTSDTLVPFVAEKLQVPILERHVFLDNERETEAIRLALEEGLKSAEARGYAVMIGHVWSQELADIIFDLYPEILERGYEFTTLAQLLGVKFPDPYR